jgi:protocatechuate 3,4-dioxygenase beta subunit
VLNRKEALVLFGGTGIATFATLLIGCGGGGADGGGATSLLPSASPSPTASTGASASPTPTPTPTASASPVAVDCVAAPALTEGPYFVEEKLNRSDIRTDPATGAVSAGIPLVLTLNLARVADGCAPLAGATVDIWHCDAAGLYSDEAANGTSGKKFLRGYQTTDANGQVRFTTIYPGWYSGRAVHVHFKVRLYAASGAETYEFTSQFFFDDSFTDTVYAKAPYSSRGTRTTRNSNDGIYQGGGSQLILPVTASGDGYAATFTIGLTV